MSTEELDDRLIVIMAITAVVVVVAVILLFTVFVSKKNKLIRERLQSKLESQRELHELELQALRSQMNPHFVHNSLNAIQYYIQRNEVELSEEYLNRFSKLFRSFFELSRQHTISLKEEIELLNNYLAIEKMRFEDKLSFDIEVDEDLELDTKIPSLLLQPIVENAVNHGIFHKNESGLVRVIFTCLDELSYKVVIEDDGIGLKRSKEVFKASGKTLENRSSTVLKDRLKLLEYSNAFKVDYQIKDREDLQGTRVTITFKILNV
ncbi:sensor histidine kinase [Leeuwenhoekiella parthenopeia]|uniref:Histidine kinase n=1 Tax=Leeuwenhoekiella parthenopeia TaxID=2890320 RepID=A0ABS8GSL4_9FLAO|nr:histidine kinase [Leeuwenhoekiella parthenopeia]MCC4212733.1 histidine kinase [Leeuwenhoekiella parthenopeia]